MCLRVAAADAAAGWDADTWRKCRYESRTRFAALTRCFSWVYLKDNVGQRIIIIIVIYYAKSST